MSEFTGIRWKQKPRYAVRGEEGRLRGGDIVPLTHAPNIDGEEADGSVTMDSLAEMVHTDVACLEEKTAFSKEGTVVSIEDGKAYKGALDCLMATKTTALNTQRLAADAADIGTLHVSGGIIQPDGTNVADTYVRCASNPVTEASVTTKDEVSELKVGYLDGSSKGYPIDTKAVLECSELPPAPASKVYNVNDGSSARVYSKDVELTTRKDFDALSVDCIHNAGCTACIATLDVIRAKGNAVLDGSLTINGDIYQCGTVYITKAEDLEVKDCNITLRAGAGNAMAAGETAGIKVCKYNGSTDLNIVTDSNGVLRVGDGGDEKPVLLRSEEADLTDGKPLVWSSGGKSAGTTDNLNVGCINGLKDEHNACNTDGTCVPVIAGNAVQHRVIPLDYNKAPSTLCVRHSATASCVPTYKSGPWMCETEGYAYVGTDYTLEIGCAIDFHQPDHAGDYSARLCISSDGSCLVFNRAKVLTAGDSTACSYYHEGNSAACIKIGSSMICAGSIGTCLCTCEDIYKAWISINPSASVDICSKGTSGSEIHMLSGDIFTTGERIRINGTCCAYVGVCSPDHISCGGLSFRLDCAASYGAYSRPMLVGASITFNQLKACYAASDPTLPYLGSLSDNMWYTYLLIPHRSGISCDNNCYANLFYTEMQNSTCARIRGCMISGSTDIACWKCVCVAVDCAEYAVCAVRASCVPTYKSGPWMCETKGYAYVGTDHTLEIGCAIDFHQPNYAGDYSARLCISGDSASLLFKGQRLARVASFDTSTRTLNLVS